MCIVILAMIMIMTMFNMLMTMVNMLMTMVTPVSRSSLGECGRDILVFHCEFSSQRGPDFYKKLRYQYNLI